MHTNAESKKSTEYFYIGIYQGSLSIYFDKNILRKGKLIKKNIKFLMRDQA